MPARFKKGRALDALNLTPLIDVLCFLVIFFLIATRFEQDERALPVHLPSAASAVPMTMEPSEMVVNVDANGEYMIRGERMGISRVEALIQQAITDNPVNQVIVIRGDRQVALQSVVSVMDVCNRLKVPSYRVTTEDIPDER